jgi:hypothetical protein
MTGKRRLKKHEMTELMGVQTDGERLVEWLQSDVDDIHNRLQLTPLLQQKLERITTARSLMLQHKFVHKVTKMMTKTFGYSEVSALRDIRLMNEVFGPLMQVTKDMKRIVAEEMIRQDREMALELKDVKALQMATANYIKLHSLDKEDAEMPDLSNFEFHQNIIAVLPEQVGVNPRPAEELLQKVSDWIGNVTDIEHEDIDETA